MPSLRNMPPTLAFASPVSVATSRITLFPHIGRPNRLPRGLVPPRTSTYPSPSLRPAMSAAPPPQSPLPPSQPLPRSTPKLDPSAHSTLRLTDKGRDVAHLHPDTRVVHAGVHRDEWTTDPLKRSFVNPPVHHSSTVIFPTMAAFRHAASDWPFTGLWYGRHGNPTTFALEEAFAAVEGADNAALTASGVSACNAAILAFVQSGDHILITDAVYDPTRAFCTSFLKRFGVDTTFYSPTIDAPGLEALIQPNTKVLFVETPASLSFELMDVPALAAVAHNHGLAVIADNTWGPTLFRPFEHGVDVSVNAATKYIGGHSDLMMGIVAARDYENYRAIKASVVQLGCPPGPDDAYLALRGLRTLSVRLRQHDASARTLATWLESRDEVKRVMHPALESHPQHHLFKQQFEGASGVFGYQLVEGFSQRALDAMLDGMSIFAMGFSWGGFESLMTQTNINSARTVDTWKYGDGYGFTLRVSVGLEEVNDLLKDLEDGFDRLKKANEASA